MPRPTDDLAPRAPAPLPAPLLVAASLIAVEGLVVVLLGVAELFALTSGRLTMGFTTTLFFLAYGAGLGVVAWGLWRLRGWSRAPAVLAQLMQLLLAWSFRGEATTLVSVVLALVAVVVLAGVLHPASIALLTREQRSVD